MDCDLALTKSFCLPLDAQGKGRLDFTMKFPERAYLIFARDGYHSTLFQLPTVASQECLTLTLLDASQWSAEWRYSGECEGLAIFKRGNSVIVSIKGCNHSDDGERIITCFHPDVYANNSGITPLKHSVWWREVERALSTKKP